MKARKKERHTELMNEVIKQVSLFKPQPQMIKQAIERLIEKEYLERDDSDRQVYIYIP
jgi:cullin 3